MPAQRVRGGCAGRGRGEVLLEILLAFGVLWIAP